MNFIIEKYLSNFVEIDTSQTKASIFSGIINLKNLKIKSEIFESLNLPNFEVIHGYIGSMTIKLKMPRRCPVCGGTGVINCSYCSGNGCRWCHEDGSATCPNCGGLGWVDLDD